MEIIDTSDEEILMGTYIMHSGEEVVGMGELSGCVTKECEDVEVVCKSNDVEIVRILIYKNI